MRAMLSLVRRVVDDSASLAKVCGPRVTTRWLFEIARNLPGCIRTHNLSPADIAMGEGPFDAKLRTARARLAGPWIMGGIREIWARDVYLGGGFLQISNGDAVVDLGANVGNFTTLALAHGPEVRVVSVEANPAFSGTFHRNQSLNGWSARARLFNVFVGGTTATQAEMKGQAGLAEVPVISEDVLIERSGLTHIDFLKCDIEGSEFGLFGAESRLLRMSSQVAMEVHKAAGDANALTGIVRSCGFEVAVTRENESDFILLARRSVPRNSSLP
jgi:FkbM family methyltransferase